MKLRRRGEAELREAMRRVARDTRDSADEMARFYGGCDDPLHPFMPVGDKQPFRDWVDFHDRVCVPLVLDADEASVQEAMRLYRQASPAFIATALFLAARAKPSVLSSLSRTIPT